MNEKTLHDEFRTFFFVCVSFMLLGGIIGVFSFSAGDSRNIIPAFDSQTSELSFARRLLTAGWSFALSVFLSSSTAGLFVIPPVCFIRGFSLAFSVAAASGAGMELSDLIRSFGVSAIVTVPTLLISSALACMLSLSIHRSSRGKDTALTCSRLRRICYKVYLVCLLLINISALVYGIL